MRKFCQGYLFLWAKGPGSEAKRRERAISNWQDFSKRVYLKGLNMPPQSKPHWLRWSLFLLGIYLKVYCEVLPPKPVFSVWSRIYFSFSILAIPFILNFRPSLATSYRHILPTFSQDHKDGRPKQLQLHSSAGFLSPLFFLRCLNTQHRSPGRLLLSACGIWLGLSLVFWKLISVKRT